MWIKSKTTIIITNNKIELGYYYLIYNCQGVNHRGYQNTLHNNIFESLNILY